MSYKLVIATKRPAKTFKEKEVIRSCSLSVELKRNRLKTDPIAVVMITVVIMDLYLLAAILQIDTADTDTEMFMSHNFLQGLAIL